MSDAAESRDIKENFVENGIKVDVEATTINLDCIKSEPNEGTLDFKEDNHSTQYKITLKYEDIYGESSPQIKIEEDYDNLIGFLENDVIMENAMIKLEAVKEEEEDDGSFNNFCCRNCKRIYKGYCLKCSTLLCILNNNMSIASDEAESNTIPTDILEIRATSKGKGVYLLRTLPINIIFGPFEGILGIESTIEHSWKIIDNKLRNIKSGNWMKNIVCAASASLKNLDIFQIDGSLYFQTNREITEGEELLIYYNDDELQQLDNTEECLYTPQKREKLPKIFACTVCCLGFGSNKCLMKHKGKCCRMEYSRSMDEFVLIECHYCKMWMEKWEHEEYHVAYCLEKHHRSWSDYSEMNCGWKDDKRRYQHETCSRPNDRRNKLKFNTKDYQCVSGGNDDETRCLNECGGGGLVKRSNNEQTQNNTIATNNSHCYNNLNKHRGIKSFQCDICMMTFTLKGNLKKHIKNTHADDTTDKDYKCSECSYYQTNNKSNFQTHINKHKGIKPFRCNICTAKFTEKASLKRHITNKHTGNGGVKDYKCPECCFRTNYKSDLQRHLNKHKGIKPFQCDTCMMKFTQKNYLKIHIKNTHADDSTDKDYKCSHCFYQTNDKSNLQRHLNKHKGIKPFQCNICMAKFTQKGNLTTHIRNKHTDDGGDKDYRCSECSYQTNDKGYFQIHLNKHKGIEPFKCGICLMKFTLKYLLKLHIRSKHTDDANGKDYKCLECSFETNYKSDLQRHLNKHRGITYMCDICMMKFTQKYHLKTHIKNRHADDSTDKDYKCSHCSFQTNYKFSFQTHLNKHKGIKPFQCEICMQKFSVVRSLRMHIRNKHTADGSAKDNLQTHLNKHKGIKPFQCDICKVSFNQKGNLTTHIKNKHTDDANGKDYKCLECSFETNHKGNLQIHLNKHKGIKPFKCDICANTFSQKGNLKSHIKNRHTDDVNGKDYKCLKCSYETNYKSDLQKHLNKHKGIKPFQCDICTVKFTLKDNLKRHIKNTHADDKSVKD